MPPRRGWGMVPGLVATTISLLTELRPHPRPSVRLAPRAPLRHWSRPTGARGASRPTTERIGVYPRPSVVDDARRVGVRRSMARGSFLPLIGNSCRAGGGVVRPFPRKDFQLPMVGCFCGSQTRAPERASARRSRAAVRVTWKLLSRTSLGKHVLIRVHRCPSVVKTPAALPEHGLARVMLTNR